MGGKRRRESVLLAGPGATTSNAEAGPSTPRAAVIPASRVIGSSLTLETPEGHQGESDRRKVTLQLAGGEAAYDMKLSRKADLAGVLGKASKKLGVDGQVRITHVRDSGKEVDIMDNFDFDAFRSRAFASPATTPLIVKVYPSVTPAVAPPSAVAAHPPSGISARDAALALIRSEAPAASPSIHHAIASKKGKAKMAQAQEISSKPSPTPKSATKSRKRPRSPSAEMPNDGPVTAMASVPQSAPDGASPSTADRPSKKRRRKRDSVAPPLLTSIVLPPRPNFAQRMSALDRYRPAVSSPLSRPLQASPLLGPIGSEDVPTDDIAPLSEPAPAVSKETGKSRKKIRKKKADKSRIALPSSSASATMFGGVANSPTYLRQGYSSSSIDTPPKEKTAAEREPSISPTPMPRRNTSNQADPTSKDSLAAAPAALPPAAAETASVPKRPRKSRKASPSKTSSKKAASPTATATARSRTPLMADLVRQIANDILVSYRTNKDNPQSTAGATSTAVNRAEDAPSTSLQPAPTQITPAKGKPGSKAGAKAAKKTDSPVQKEKAKLFNKEDEPNPATNPTAAASALEPHVPADIPQPTPSSSEQPQAEADASDGVPIQRENVPMTAADLATPASVAPPVVEQPTSAAAAEVAADILATSGVLLISEAIAEDAAPECEATSAEVAADIIATSGVPATTEATAEDAAPEREATLRSGEVEGEGGTAATLVVNQSPAVPTNPPCKKAAAAKTNPFAPTSIRERRSRPSRTLCLICQEGQHLQADCPIVKAGLASVRQALDRRRQETTEGNERETSLAIEALELWVDKLASRQEMIARKIRGDGPLPVETPISEESPARPAVEVPIASENQHKAPPTPVAEPTTASATAAISIDTAQPEQSETTSEKPSSDKDAVPAAHDVALASTGLATQTPVRKNRLVQPIVPDTTSRMPEIYRIAVSKSGSVSGMSASSALIESGSSDSGSSSDSLSGSLSDSSDSESGSEDDEDGSGSGSDTGSESSGSRDSLDDFRPELALDEAMSGDEADSGEDEEEIMNASGKPGAMVDAEMDVDEGVAADDEQEEGDDGTTDLPVAEPATAQASERLSLPAVEQAEATLPEVTRDNTTAQAQDDATDTESGTSSDTDSIHTATSVTASNRSSPTRSRSPSISGRSSATSPVRYEDPHELMQRIMSQTLSRKDQRRARQSAAGMQDVVLSDPDDSQNSDNRSEATVRRDVSGDDEEEETDRPPPHMQSHSSSRRLRSASVSSIGDFEDGATSGGQAGVDADGDVEMEATAQEDILPSSLAHPPAFASESIDTSQETDQNATSPSVSPNRAERSSQHGSTPPVQLDRSSQAEQTPRSFRQLQREAGSSPVIGDLDGSKAFEEARAEEQTPLGGASMALPATQTSSQQSNGLVPTQTTTESAPVGTQRAGRITRQTRRSSALPESSQPVVPQTPPRPPPPISQRQLRQRTVPSPRPDVTPRMQTRRSVSREPNAPTTGLGLDVPASVPTPPTPWQSTYRTRRQAQLPSSQVDELASSQLGPPFEAASQPSVASAKPPAIDGEQETFSTPPESVEQPMNGRRSRRIATASQPAQPEPPLRAGPRTRRTSAASSAATSSAPASPVQLRRSARRTASASVEPPLQPPNDLSGRSDAGEQTPRPKATPLFMEASQVLPTQAYKLYPSTIIDSQEETPGPPRRSGLQSGSRSSMRAERTSTIPEEVDDDVSASDDAEEDAQSYRSPVGTSGTVSANALSLEDVIPGTQLSALPNGQASRSPASPNADDDARSEVSEASVSAAGSDSDVEPDSPVLTPRPRIAPRSSLNASQPAFSYPTLSSLSQTTLRLGTSAYERVTGLGGLGGRMFASQPTPTANGYGASSRNGSVGGAGGKASTIFGTEDEDGDGDTTEDSSSSSDDDDDALPPHKRTAAAAATGGGAGTRGRLSDVGSRLSLGATNGSLKGRYAGQKPKKRMSYGESKGW